MFWHSPHLPSLLHVSPSLETGSGSIHGIVSLLKSNRGFDQRDADSDSPGNVDRRDLAANTELETNSSKAQPDPVLCRWGNDGGVAFMEGI